MKNYITRLFTDIEKSIETSKKLVGLVFCPLPLALSWYDIALVNKKENLNLTSVSAGCIALLAIFRPFSWVLCLHSLPSLIKTLHFCTHIKPFTQGLWWHFELIQVFLVTLWTQLSPSCSPKNLKTTHFWVIFQGFLVTPSATPWDTSSILYLPKALQALSVWLKFAVITSSHSFELLQFAYFMNFQDPEASTEPWASKTKPTIFSLAGPVLTKFSILLHFEMLHTQKNLNFGMAPGSKDSFFKSTKLQTVKDLIINKICRKFELNSLSRIEIIKLQILPFCKSGTPYWFNVVHRSCKFYNLSMELGEKTSNEFYI